MGLLRKSPDQVRQLNTVLNACFQVDPVDMVFYSLQRDKQGIRNVLVALPLADQFHDLGFAFGNFKFADERLQAPVEFLPGHRFYKILIQVHAEEEYRDEVDCKKNNYE